MTKEMITRELKATIEIYNEISKKYTEFKNKFNMTSDCFEESLSELEQKMSLLGKLEELY